MTIIKGDSRIVIIDPLISTEYTHAALSGYYTNCAEKPVLDIIYTYSHANYSWLHKYYLVLSRFR